MVLSVRAPDIRSQGSHERNPARFSRAGLFAILIAGLVATLACSSQPVSDVGGEATPATSDSGVAPDFVVADIAGTEFSFADTAGQVRLIDFWATWCAPCREEIPMLVELDKNYRDQGLTILAISDEDADVVRKFVDKEGVTYRNLVDAGVGEDGEAFVGRVAEDYLVLGLPTGFLIDREGKIVERFTGPKPAKILEKRIRELLELPPA